jgi:hypothetical protein
VGRNSQRRVVGLPTSFKSAAIQGVIVTLPRDAESYVSAPPHYPEAAMIKLLAEFFRGFHYVVGVSAPPPGTSDRAFVFAWLGAIAFFVAVFVILIFYLIPFLYFRH